MKVKDLLKNNVDDAKAEEKAPALDSINTVEEYSAKDYLLEYKKHFMDRALELKDERHEYFKISSLAINYAYKEITLAKKLYGYPFYSPGKKGMLLKDNVLEIFPDKYRLIFEKALKKENVILVLFPDGVMSIPTFYIRELKERKEDEIQ